MKVLMQPTLGDVSTNHESGIRRVIEAYYKYLPKYGIEFVDCDIQDKDAYDVLMVHISSSKELPGDKPIVAVIHGFYWADDNIQLQRWQLESNKQSVRLCRAATEIIAVSNWVADVFRRDMRIEPNVIGHGIDYDIWQNSHKDEGYVLWAKNREHDVCSPKDIAYLASSLPHIKFKTTFGVKNAKNVEVLGMLPHNDMRKVIQRAAVYLSTPKETFGITILEALASGVPVVSYAYGGALELVDHGVDGYLAKPGDVNDLMAGVEYCLKYRDTLSKNARLKRFTWEEPIKKIADVLHRVAEVPPPTVGVVIPCFNKSSSISETIDSVLSQERKPERIIVVDDGSTDDSAQIIKNYPVEYVYQSNSGVAKARNVGLEMLDTKYVIFLDGDDRIKPPYIKRCLDAMEADQSIAVGYTRLEWEKQDGSSGISEWPREWNYDTQLKQDGTGNQIPTCCMCRTDVIRRLGGYRSRYCPSGAGSEDAALWLMLGAYGYKAELVTEEPLFLYAFMSGHTSQPNYNQVNYTELQSYVHDGMHPLFSYATPTNKISHLAMQRDEPLVSVIIPVGPSHLDVFTEAVDSVAAQRGFSSWEVIVVNDSGVEIPKKSLKAYPFVKFYNNNTSMGAGFSRNVGARHAKGKFLVFLDADDELLPFFLQKTISNYGYQKSIVFTDYLGTAIIDEREANRLKSYRKLIHDGGRDKVSIISYPTYEPEQDYNCELAQKMPDDPMYHWCLVTCLIPKAWHFEIGGFDEGMESWEDVDYHFRMAYAGKCYTRIKEPLVVYRFLGGTRRNIASSDTPQSRDVARHLIQYMKEKKEGITMSPCSSCGSRKTVQTRTQTIVHRTATEVTKQIEKLSDDKFDWYYFTYPGKGEHDVFGSTPFKEKLDIAGYGYNWARSNNGWVIKYGRRPFFGEPFLALKSDAEAQPNYYKLAIATVDEVEQETPIPEVVEQPPKLIQPPPFDLQSLPGVSGKVAESMRSLGIVDRESIISAGIEGLTKVDGIGNARAEAILDYLLQ